MKGKANLLAMTAVAITVMTGCANSVEPSPSGTSEPSVSTPASSPSTAPSESTGSSEPEGTPLPEQQLDATALPQAYPKQVWVAPDGKKVTITAQESGCGKASAELGEQTPQRVKVVLVETVPSAPQMCTMDIRHPKVTVDLGQALGDRVVELTSQQRKS